MCSSLGQLHAQALGLSSCQALGAGPEQDCARGWLWIAGCVPNVSEPGWESEHALRTHLKRGLKSIAANTGPWPGQQAAGLAGRGKERDTGRWVQVLLQPLEPRHPPE